MEHPTRETAVSSDLIISLKKKTPKFKAGAELSSSVNLVDVGYSVGSTEDSYVLELTMHLSSEAKDAVK